MVLIVTLSSPRIFVQCARKASLPLAGKAEAVAIYTLTSAVASYAGRPA